MPNTVTDGVSPKAHAATIAPLAGGLVVALINWAITGQFDSTSVAAVIAGSGGGVVSGAAAYAAKPGPIREVATDAKAVVEAVEKADPGLTAAAKTFVEKELAKVPAAFQPALHAIEEDVVDPLLADIPVSENVPPAQGDAGVADVPAPDPRDAQIASLTEQIAALRGSQVTVSGPATLVTNIDPATGLPVPTS